VILVDTSIWVDHFRRGLPELAEQLESAAVVCHPFVLGELACGHLRNRREILELLQTLCTCPVAAHEEVLHFIESNRLMRFNRDAPYFVFTLSRAIRTRRKRWKLKPHWQ
jgi:hypothetical protein